MTIDLKTLKAMSDGAMIMAAQAEQMAIFDAGMVEGTKQMAESLQSIVNDCARQLAERRAAENGAENGGVNSAENNADVAAAQAACDSADQETAANVSSPNSPSLPQNAASGAFRPDSGQTGRPDAGSSPAPSQGAVSASTANQTHAAIPQATAATPQANTQQSTAAAPQANTPQATAAIPQANPPQTHAAIHQTAPQTPPLELVTLRAFVAERSTPENRAKIKAILSKYGVRKLTELKESQYEAVRNEVAAL